MLYQDGKHCCGHDGRRSDKTTCLKSTFQTLGGPLLFPIIPTRGAGLEQSRWSAASDRGVGSDSSEESDNRGDPQPLLADDFHQLLAGHSVGGFVGTGVDAAGTAIDAAAKIAGGGALLDDR